MEVWWARLPSPIVCICPANGLTVRSLFYSNYPTISNPQHGNDGENVTFSKPQWHGWGPKRLPSISQYLWIFWIDKCHWSTTQTGRLGASKRRRVGKCCMRLKHFLKSRVTPDVDCPAAWSISSCTWASYTASSAPRCGRRPVTWLSFWTCHSYKFANSCYK